MQVNSTRAFRQFRARNGSRRVLAPTVRSRQVNLPFVGNVNQSDFLLGIVAVLVWLFLIQRFF